MTILKNLLLVSGMKKSSEALESMLREIEPFTILTVSTAALARAAMMSRSFSLVVINTPLGDEFGHDLALEALDKGSGAILLVKDESTESIFHQVGTMGVSVVPKPIHKTVFVQAVHLSLALHKRLGTLQEKNKMLESQLEEMRLVDRAKCTLIQYVKMTEPQAHRYIEKHAMDMRTSRKEVALNILKMYED